ncbi:ABC transporter ATP-binding protein [Methylobacter sp.]|uniref:ABC transporter ATP-binding protein n=1 Tax=Methylobacter sp. TaxID=2051955 RepID=UPI002487FF6F|nr:ABC transporter ATP-binding protein [Methylobacter sp.]MDI1276629.1 ABC transporter ATP-binding protein [Methylobacter sp.]MDI1357264.1 ABC transporter ATP-binding protein [Methylobacter sp.]
MTDIAIRVQNISKCYQIYENPRDRLKQFVLPRMQRFVGKEPKQYFREFWALKDVSFEIKKGETVGIIGRNGSGKSTLLQLICGTLNPTGGSIQTNGRIAALLELGSGFNPEFTGRENVYMNAAVLGLSKKEIDARFDDIVSFADIGDFIEQPVKTYSSGMFVRLAFAIQANVDPEILIVDEALAVGDAYFVHRCMERFHDLQRRGTTIIFVSHDASTVKRLCRRVLWLKNGQLALAGNGTCVVDAYLQDLFRLSEKKRNNLDDGRYDLAIPQKNNSKSKLSLPSGDGRYGERHLEMIGMLLSNVNGLPTSTVAWNGLICLLLEIRNNDLPPGQNIGCGYIVRDNKGIEIASTSTWFDSVEILAPAQGDSLRVLIEITIPMLHPGHYSLTPSVSSIPEGEGPLIQDRILNAFIFEVTTTQQIVTPIRLVTQFSVLVNKSSVQNCGDNI